MADREIHYTPNPSAVPFHESALPVKALCGPVGSGKSLAGCMEFFLCCLRSRVPVHGVVIRESYRQLHDSTRKTWMEWFGPLTRYVESKETAEVTVVGEDGEERTHELMFRHARREEDASNLLSTEFGFIWLEEPVPAFEVSKRGGQNGTIGAGLKEGIFDIALTRLRQRQVKQKHCILTFNPPNRYHWVYRRFFMPSREELERDGFVLFRQPARENTANLPANYYQLLEKTLSPDMARRFVEGEPVTMYPGVRVFPEFYEQLHVTDEDIQPEPGRALVIGMDFGLTPVAVIGQVTESGRLLIFRELQCFNTGAVRFGAMLRDVLKNEFPENARWRVWGDPAGAQKSQTDEVTVFQVLEKAGFHVQPARQDWASRREAVMNRLTRTFEGRSGLLVKRSSCPILSEGLLGGYRYPRSVDGRQDVKPLKNEFSHSADALQYLCVGEFDVVSGERKMADDPLFASRAKPPKYNPLEIDRSSGWSWMSR